MKKRKWQNSLQYRLVGWMAGVLVLVCGLIIAYNLYLYQAMEQQMDENIKKSLGFYTEEVAFAMDHADQFLISKGLDQDAIRKIRTPREEIDRFLAISEIQELFWESIVSYGMMDGLFFYDREDGIYIGNTKLYEKDYGRFFEGSMGRLVKQFEKESEKQENQWFSIEIAKEQFLVKMYEIQDVYVGCWIHANTILKKLEGLSVYENDEILLLDAKGNVLRTDFSIQRLSEEDNIVKVNQTKYKKLIPDTKSAYFSFAILQNRDKFWNNRNNLQLQVAVAGMLILLFCALMWLTQKRLFERPLTRLVHAMNQLKAGNLDIHLSEENQLEEFEVLNDTFDQMTEEIKKLKIDVYEEMLRKQKAELLYLQEQINPHFLTNCMNLIRNLSVMGEEEKVQSAAVLVSRHMRYSLANSTLVTVKREMEHVANFEKLQKMRYGEQFSLKIQIEEELEDCRIPTMLIQAFVENAIKHQREPENHLQIEVKIWQEKEWLLIQIRDSGEGFSPDVLKQLRCKEKCRNSEGEQIGIYNVCQRLAILYGEKAEIYFLNGENWGAQIRIQLPISK